jgi:glutaconate CoA-transferase subunit A
MEQNLPRPVLTRNHSNFTIALALKAAALGISFLPARTGVGGDIVKDEGAFRPVECPFTGERMTAVRAVVSDVAILHVQRTDAFGNAHLWG